MPTVTADRAAERTDRPLRITNRIGSMTYKVSVHFSKTSRETMGDKLVRLIERDAVKITPRATASDSRKEGTMNDNKLTILYEKLSHEDGRENESLSIEHQELLCKGWRSPLSSLVSCLANIRDIDKKPESIPDWD